MWCGKKSSVGKVMLSGMGLRRRGNASVKQYFTISQVSDMGH